MSFPPLTDIQRLSLLEPPAGPVDVVLDTDTYNEIDDQFAVAYAMLAGDRLNLRAICAAPFHNQRSDGPGDGMVRSYDEILRVLERLGPHGRPPDGFVYRGSTAFLSAADAPVDSEAARRLVELAMAPREGPLYVLAIGAITNVASAILLEPQIIERIVVVWLGGHAPDSPHTIEFNLRQDLHASRLIFDCGVPFVWIPCRNVAEHLRTTDPEMAAYVKGRGPVGDYLYEIYHDYCRQTPGFSKVIWDISTVAWVIRPDWVPTVIDHSPILTDQVTWSVDRARPLIRVAVGCNRDAVFGDLFQRLEATA